MKETFTFNNKEAQQVVECSILDANNEADIIEAAECIAEAFAGVDINGKRVYEPMLNACKLSQESIFKWVYGYIRDIVKQGYCLIARDKVTGKIVGTIACDNYNPDEESPIFEGDLLPLNKIVPVLEELDIRFLEAIHRKTGKKATKDEYIHGYMCGGRNSDNRGMIIAKLTELLMNKAAKEGYKGFFVEATNNRSSKVMVKSLGFQLVHDINQKPIVARYADYDDFKVIPTEVSEDCRILYKALSPGFEL